MKKTLKNLTIVGALSAAAIGGVLAGTYTSVSANAYNESISTQEVSGELDSADGLLVMDDVALPTFTIAGNTLSTSQVVEGATMDVEISSFRRTTDTSATTNTLRYQFTIQMPESYTYVVGHENAIQMAATLETSSDAPIGPTEYVPTWTYDVDTNSFTGRMLMPRAITQYNFTLMINDTFLNSYQVTDQVYETDGDVYNTDLNTMEVVYTFSIQSWDYVDNLEEMPTLSNLSVTYKEDETVGTETKDYMTVTFDVDTNGFTATQTVDEIVGGNTNSPNAEEASFTGDVIIPMVESKDLMMVDLDVETAASDISEEEYEVTQIEGNDSTKTTDDIYNVTYKIDASNIYFQIVDSTFVIGDALTEPSASIFDDSTNVADRAYGALAGVIIPQVQRERNDYAYGNLVYTNSYLDNAGAVDTDLSDNTNRLSSLDLENSFVMAEVSWASVNSETGNEDGTVTTYLPTEAAYQATLDAYEADNYNGFGPWTITGIVIGSIAGAALIGGVGYYYYTQSKAKKATK